MKICNCEKKNNKLISLVLQLLITATILCFLHYNVELRLLLYTKTEQWDSYMHTLSEQQQNLYMIMTYKTIVYLSTNVF